MNALPVVVIMTNRVNEALLSRLSGEEKRLLHEACGAEGVQRSILFPDALIPAMRRALENNSAVVVLIAEGQSAVEFQATVTERFANQLDRIAILRVIVDPLPRSPETDSENVIPVSDVPSVVWSTVASFRKRKERKEEAGTTAEEQAASPDDQNGGVIAEEQRDTQEEPDKKQKEERKDSSSPIFRFRRKGGEPVGTEDKKGKDRSTPPVPSSSPSPPSPPPSSRPSGRSTRAVVLRCTEFVVCATSSEIEEARKILKKDRLYVKIYPTPLKNFPVSGAPIEQRVAVVDTRNVMEVVSPAMFILVRGLLPEEAAAYLPEGSIIQDSGVHPKDVGESIARVIRSVAVQGEVFLPEEEQGG